MALSGKREAFRVDTIARGLDHTRTTFLKAYGHYVADSATTFEAGMVVSLATDGEVVVHPGTDVAPFGVAAYNKDTTISASVAAEPIQFATSGGTATLAHNNLVVTTSTNKGLRITSNATGIGATEYAETTDFTFVASTGVVTHVAGGTPLPTGTTVYAWYRYNLTAAELLQDGKNFWNLDDDVSIQENKIKVIEAPATIYTTQYNSERPWDVGDQVSPGDLGTDACQGLWDRTASSTNTVVIGTVVQLPTAEDPFMGIKYTG